MAGLGAPAPELSQRWKLFGVAAAVATCVHGAVTLAVLQILSGRLVDRPGDYYSWGGSDYVEVKPAFAFQFQISLLVPTLGLSLCAIMAAVLVAVALVLAQRQKRTAQRD